LELSKYQAQALETDQVPAAGDEAFSKAIIVPMLGLAGETGQLLTEYKKHLRDGEAHRLFQERVAEELGDLLWYVSNVASKFGLDLDDVAQRNLAKVQARWARATEVHLPFDSTMPEAERLPRRMVVTLAEEFESDLPRVRMSVNGEPIGSRLGDNAYDADGYRFHDVFHLAYAAGLGWSPNLRAFLKRKRKSQPLVDDVEDGGRACVIEEAVAALAFDYARAHNFLEGVAEVDDDLLRTIKSMTSHLEVSRATTGDWERVILAGFTVWRTVMASRGGRIEIDLDAQAIRYLGPA